MMNRVWDIPYEQVMMAKSARATLEKFRGISPTDLAFMKLSGDPRIVKYQNAVDFLREYERKYYN